MSEITPGAKQPLFGGHTYDTLKWVALVLLPAMGALYFSLSEIWNLPYAIQIVGSISVIDTVLGGLLGVSSKRYNQSDARYDGAMVVDTRDPKKDIYSLNLNTPLDELSVADSITLKVENPPRLRDSQ